MSTKNLPQKEMFTTTSRSQRTLGDCISFSGNGLFTGVEVDVTIYPAKPGTGIVFKRVDLEGAGEVAAIVQNLFATPRCTILGGANNTIVCVEHLLSALAGCGVDNAIIELNGGEIPILDGSAKPFVEFIEKVGVVAQEEELSQYHLKQPLFLTEKDMQIIALPSDKLEYSYTLSYPNHPILGGQFISFDSEEDSYAKEIAPARTFSPKEEVEALIEQGLLKSVSLDHGVILDGSFVMNPEGLRFTNEMARHKLLDMIGDLSLSGVSIIAHFIGIKSGHSLNTAFALLLQEKLGESR